MTFDLDRIDDAVLALLYLTLHDGYRAWKGFDWDALNRLHERGMLDDPRNKNKSVVLTEEGLRRSKELFEAMFVKHEAAPAGGAGQTARNGPPRSPDAVNKDLIYVVRASLRPKLYRDIEIAATRSLFDLAKAINDAFGFAFDHPFGFYSESGSGWPGASERYELFADIGEGEGPGVKRTRIANVFRKVGATMTFLFDYGDEWTFRVSVIDATRKQAGAKYPRIVKSVGEAPAQYSDPDED